MAKQKETQPSPNGTTAADAPAADAPADTSPVAITDLGEYGDIRKLMSPGMEKRQSMQGFDEDYIDIVDYIVRCTYKIWEQKGVGLIYSHYRHNSLIHTSDGMTYGRDKVIADSIRTMAAFPDLRLYADDVIWSGDDQQGFHTSHRITWMGRNTGHSIYGPPTGRKVLRRGIAHCFVRENRVVEEWICRDELALVRQLGLDEHALARRLAHCDAEAGLLPPETLGQGEVDRVIGQETPLALAEPDASGDDVDGKLAVENMLRRSFHEIWNWRLLNKIDDYYVPNYLAFVSTNRKLYGLGEYKGYVLGWLAAFSDLRLHVDHIAVLGDAEHGYRTATRWTLQGTHDGPSAYDAGLGGPTGQRIFLIGITHHHIRDGKFIQEWSCWDEFALLKQLHRSSGGRTGGFDLAYDEVPF